MNKVFTGLHCLLLHEHAFPQLCRMRLYAYLPARGTKDCLLIVSDLCRRVKDLCALHQRDPDPVGIWGDLQVSPNLEKAFDIVGRDHVLKNMEVFDLSHDLRYLINSRLFPHDYCLSYKDFVSRFRAHRGINKVPVTPRDCGLCVCTISCIISLLLIPSSGFGNILRFLLMTLIFAGLWILCTRRKKPSMTSPT